MNVMLLAAGEGTRLRPYTLQLPKPAIPFLTVPLAAHSLGFLKNTTVDKLLVNTYHLPEKVHQLFHQLPHGAQSLHFSNEQGQLLGNGGGLAKAKSFFVGGGNFLLMNSDEVILPEDPHILEKALAHHVTTNALSTLLVMDHPGVGSEFGGVWTTKENRVLGFGKQNFAGSEKAWHFVGVQILSERIFDYLPTGTSNILYDGVTTGIRHGEVVEAFPINCAWFETGNIKDYIAASKQCFKHATAPTATFQKTALLWTLSRFGTSPLRIEDHGAFQLVAGQNSKISETARLEGLIVVGNNSEVSSSCRLKDVIIGEGVRLAADHQAHEQLLL